MMKEDRQYEAPQVRDLEELGLEGLLPLGVNTCSVGSNGTNTCQPNGTGPGVNSCGAGTR